MIVELANGSAAEGHDVAIAYGIRPETPSDLRSLVHPGVELHPLPWTSRRPDALARGTLALRRLLRAQRPDVVHLHSSFSGVLGAAATPSDVPTVFSPNAFASVLPEGGKARRAAYRRLERTACRRVTVVGAVSHSEADLAREMGARRVVMVPNGIADLEPDCLVTRPDGWEPERPVVLATGRTVPQRQPEQCARILQGVADVAEVAWLGGGGGDRGVAGREALEAAGVPITGWLPREEVLGRIAEASAYLHYTAWDGLPLSVLEAVALDVVVVASDIQPNRQILGDDGVCATEEEAIARLRRIVADPGYAQSLREAQRARRDEFSASRMVQRWHEVYDELVGAAPRAASASTAAV